MKILLIGDSWGIGTFSSINNEYRSTGQGIETVLKSRGYQIINISCAGGSNWLMIDRLEGLWHTSQRCIFGVNVKEKKHFDLNEIDCIVFLQTDIFRERSYYGPETPDSKTSDWKILEQDFVDKLTNYESLHEFTEKYFYALYNKLNSFDKPILCIGGWAQLHPMIVNFNNLVPLIYSATKFLIPTLSKDCYISDREWFLQLEKNSHIMYKFGDELKSLTIDSAEKLDIMITHWQDVHPTLEGYTKLADCIDTYLQQNFKKTP